MSAVDDHPKRQRVAAYAVIRRDDDQVLLVRLAPHVRFQGWTLPGGGIDHGEEPRAGLRREIYEETGLHAEPTALLDVHSIHHTGARFDGVVEDYHGIHLIFEAELTEGSRHVEPHVVDVGGSSDLAQWVPLDDVGSLTLSGAARHALALVRQST